MSVGYTLESWLDHQFLMKKFPAENEGQFVDRRLQRTSFSIQPTVNANARLSKRFSLLSTVGFSSRHTGVNLIDFIGHIGLRYKKGNLTANLSMSRAAQNQSIELALDSFKLQNQVSNNIALDIKYKGVGVNIYRHQLGDLSSRNNLFEILSLQNLDNLPLGYTDPNNNFLGVDNPIITGISLHTDHTIKGFNIHSNLTLQDSKVDYYGAIFTSATARSPLDYGYIFNIRLQKEWKFNQERAFGISASYHMRGGETQLSVSTRLSREWGYTEFIHSAPPQLKLSDYYRADLRIYYKPSKRSTISIDIQNVTNRENDAYYYYEPLTQEATLKKQLGLIPILSWRVDW